MAIGESQRTTAGIGSRRFSSDSEEFERSRESQSDNGLETRGTGIGASGKRNEPGSKNPLGFWGRVAKHLKRYWICYGLLGVIFLAIFLPVLSVAILVTAHHPHKSAIILQRRWGANLDHSFLVIIPAIAQRLVSDADIPVHSVEVLNPTPDNITFSLHASLKVPLGLSVRIDPFDLNLFNREVKPMTPYVTVPLGKIKLKGESAISLTNQTTKIQNMKEFTNFLTKAVYSKRFTLSAYGKTTAHLGKLKVPLKLDKDLELNGLDKLSGFSIDKAGLALPPKEDGSNLAGMATIPNHSVVTFALGNETLNLKVGDLSLGNGTINNVFLRPGNNTVPLRGILDIKNAIQNVDKLLEAETDSITKGDVQLSASGQSTVYNGVHVPYFEKVLGGLTVTAQVPLLRILVGTVSQLASSNSGALQNATNALQGLDLTSGPNMTNSTRK